MLRVSCLLQVCVATEEKRRRGAKVNGGWCARPPRTACQHSRADELSFVGAHDQLGLHSREDASVKWPQVSTSIHVKRSNFQNVTVYSLNMYSCDPTSKCELCKVSACMAEIQILKCQLCKVSACTTEIQVSRAQSLNLHNRGSSVLTCMTENQMSSVKSLNLSHRDPSVKCTKS